MVLSLAYQLVVLFIMMACGWLLVKGKLLRVKDSRVLSIINIYIIQPCVIIRAFQIELTETVRTGFLFSLGTALIVNLMLIGVTMVFSRVLRLKPVEQASVIYANAGVLVIPIVSAVMGDEWVIYTTPFMCVQLCFIWTHCDSLLRGTRGIKWRNILKNLNLIAIVIGAVLMVLRIRLPSIAADVMSGMSALLGPVGMIVIGMLFAGTDLRRAVKNKRLWSVCAIKMLALPALVLLAMRLTGLSGSVRDGHTLMYISFLAVIGPSASFVTQLAQLHRQDPEYASTINVFTCLLSLITMPMMTMLFERLIG
ncbi:MAG: AEC family transporter [Clostridia bacterium]|nr:AEC family transporter [Clostridia bacterium]